LKIDGEKGDGPKFVKQFNIPGYPTLIFVNTDGVEIDRIIGYRSVDEFLHEIERINSNHGTIDDLTQQLTVRSKDDSLLIKLAEKWEDRGAHNSAMKYWKMLLIQSNNRNELAQFRVAQNKTKIEKSPKFLLDLIDSYPDNKYLPDAYRSLQNYYRVEHDTIAEANIYLSLITLLAETDKASASDLNGYAWRMTQLELNLEDGLEKIKQAVLMVSDEDYKTQAQMMDTKAEVLWKLGRSKEAVGVIKQCIQLQPEDNYYQKQKEKFEKTR